jgi:CheY-like chemotaxis protein
MKKRILIVDDREENRYLLQALLQGNGYEIVTAIHGADALEKARQNLPDLIIADILMPVMDGFVLCREWMKDERLKAIPFIFYTATYTDERDREFALGLGARQFIVKPAEPDAFLAAVRETLRLVESSSATPPDIPTEGHEEESVFLKQYNEVLVRKLEAKMEELEKTNSDLVRDIALRKAAEENTRQLNEQLEKKVAERTAELKDAVTRLESLNRVFVGREMKMTELKARIKELEETKDVSRRP